MKIKILSVLLIICTVAAIAACGETAPAVYTENSESTGIQTETVVSPDAVPKPFFENSDYRGKNFVIVWPELSINDAYYFAEEETGEFLNDTVYKRMFDVEEQLNIKITEYCPGQCTEIHPFIMKTVNAGSDEYNLVISHTAVGIGAIVADNLILDWNDINYTDRSQPYWDKEINDNLSIYGKQPYVSSAFMVPDFIVILFNKGMVTDFSLESPFELVINGRWTLDRIAEMGKVVSADVNGDGVFDMNDRYGFGTSLDWYIKTFQISCGQKIVQKNAEGKMEYVFMTERMASIAEKFYDILYNNNVSITWPYGTYQWGVIVPIFNEGRMLFLTQWMGFAENYREADVEYGIIPAPKLNEAQDRYYTMNYSGYLCIPKTVTDTDLVGKTVELLSYWGSETVIPAYKEVLLAEKVSRDNDSSAMLDIIFSTLVNDLANNYGYMEILMDLMTAKSYDIASYYEKNISRFQAILDANDEGFVNFGK